VFAATTSELTKVGDFVTMEFVDLALFVYVAVEASRRIILPKVSGPVEYMAALETTIVRFQGGTMGTLTGWIKEDHRDLQ